MRPDSDDVARKIAERRERVLAEQKRDAEAEVVRNHNEELERRQAQAEEIRSLRQAEKELSGEIAQIHRLMLDRELLGLLEEVWRQHGGEQRTVTKRKGLFGTQQAVENLPFSVQRTEPRVVRADFFDPHRPNSLDKKYTIKPGIILFKLGHWSWRFELLFQGLDLIYVQVSGGKYYGLFRSAVLKDRLLTDVAGGGRKNKYDTSFMPALGLTETPDAPEDENRGYPG